MISQYWTWIQKNTKKLIQIKTIKNIFLKIQKEAEKEKKKEQKNGIQNN